MSDEFEGEKIEDCSLVAPNKTDPARRSMLQQRQLSPAELAMVAEAQRATVSQGNEHAHDDGLAAVLPGDGNGRVPVDAVDGNGRVPVDAVDGNGRVPVAAVDTGGTTVTTTTAAVGSLAWWIYGRGLAFSGAADSRAFAAPYGPGTRYLMR